jgi:hypothetical protein
MKLNCYFSPSYFDGVTHLDQSGKKEYFLNSVIKPKWVYEQIKNEQYLNILEPSAIQESDLSKVVRCLNNTRVGNVLNFVPLEKF